MDYDVFLNLTNDHPHYELYATFGRHISLANGQKVIRLECSEATDVGPYLSVVISDKGKYPGFPLRIPHYLILQIAYVALPDKKMGFYSASDS